MDIRQQYFGISAFAKLCGLSRKTLIFYDRIGLFSPARVDANGYRRYSFSQLDMITAIQAFKELDMPLDTIRSHLLERTPENTLQLFAAQKSVIQQKIQQLCAVRDMIDFRIDMTRAGLSADTEKLELLDLPAVPILTSQPLDLPLSACPEEIWLHFYQACEAVGISCGIPTGLVIRRAPFLRGDYDTVGCLFARTSPAQQANSAIPAGRYAVGYIRAPYGCTQPLYRALDAFIRAAGLQPTGDAYEECILDEVTSADPEHYLFRLSVQVG